MEEFNPHKAKCRCCGKTVKNGKKLRKLTSKIEQDFKNLTQLEVKTYLNIVPSKVNDP